MSNLPFSVAMSVYKNDNAEFFDRALKSITEEQTVKPSEIVLVVDGPVGDEINQVIEKYSSAYGIFNVVRLEQNGGLGNALKLAVENSSNELIARMDSDDVSLPTRFEKQVAYMDSHPDVGVLGTVIQGFGMLDWPGIQIPVVTVFDMLKQNYMAHPSIMIRKSILDKHNLRYNPEYKHCEDLELWSRMIFLTKFHNVMEKLLMYRVSGHNVSMNNGEHQKKMTAEIRNNLKRRLIAAGMLQLDNYGLSQAKTENVQKISLYD